MADPPSYDQDLLKRLNALKKTNITLDTDDPILSIPKTRPTPETDLASRLRSLRDGVATRSSPNPDFATSTRPRPDVGSPSKPYVAPKAASPPLKVPFRGSGDDLWPFVTHVEPPDDIVPGNIDETEVRSVLDQAQRLLAKGNKNGTQPPKNAERLSRKPKSLPKPPPQEESEPSDAESDDSETESKQEQESREADNIIAQLLADIELEHKHAPEPPDADIDEMRAHMQSVAAAQGEQTITLPGVPSTEPQPATTAETPRKPSPDFDSDIAARMAALRNPGSGGTDALGLPSAPTSAAGKRAAPPPLPSKREVVEDWCGVCLDDATVLCLGCEGALYCARCWKEGHLGEGAGREERGHEWRRYRRAN